jgi:hypothetical protein
LHKRVDEMCECFTMESNRPNSSVQNRTMINKKRSRI